VFVKAANTVDITVNFDVTRHAISRLHKHSSSEQTSNEQFARYLAADRLIPIDGKIAQEARVVAGGIDSPLKQVRRIYDHIVDTLTYDKSGIGWGRGDALYACDIRRGNCTDFHSLFIAQTRALNIPARFIMGLPLPINKAEGSIPGYHCWAEFYIAGQGWEPVDASEASKFFQKKEKFFGSRQFGVHQIENNKSITIFRLANDLVRPIRRDPEGVQLLVNVRYGYRNPYTNIVGLGWDVANSETVTYLHPPLGQLPGVIRPLHISVPDK